MSLLQISHRLINIYIFLIPLMIFIHADLPNNTSEITLESIDKARINGFFGYIALPFKKTCAFFKNIIWGEPMKTWEYEAENVAVFAFKGGKKYMEDRFFIDEHFQNTGVSMYAIFDGHVGDFCAQYAVDNLMKYLKEKIIKLKEGTISDENLKKYYTENGSIEYLDLLKNEILITEENLQKILTNEKIRQILYKNEGPMDAIPILRKYTNEHGNLDKETLINEEIISEEELQQEPYSSGTTALIVIIENKKLFIANVGDSRIVMGKTDEPPYKRLTNDHKPSELKEYRRIKRNFGINIVEFHQAVVIEEDGPYRVNGFSVSRTLGDLEVKYLGNIVATPELFQYNLSELNSKFLIIASDGLWDEFTDEEAVKFINDRYNEKLFGAKSIAIDAQKKQKQKNIGADNITVIILKT